MNNKSPVWAVLFFGFLLSFLVAAFFGVGFQASDDGAYLAGGKGWLYGAPYVGDSHWTLRHTITLPLAVVFGALGVREISLFAVAFVYLIATIAIIVSLMVPKIGVRASLLALLIMLSAPGFSILGTYVNTDVPELFFVFGSLTLFLLAAERNGAAALLIAAGAMLALALLTRQTSLALGLLYGLCFLFFPIMPRQRYFLIAVGIVPVLLFEWCYLFVMTGDPMYRLSVDFHHDPVNRAAEFANVTGRGDFIDKEGALTINLWLDPIINMFVSQKFGLIFWYFFPFAWYLSKRNLEQNQRRFLRALLLAALVWYVFSAYNPKLYFVPRYQIFVYVCAVVTVSWGISLLWQQGSKRLVYVLSGMLVISNLALLMLENTDPRATERMVVDFVAAHPGETIFTDWNTARRAAMFAELQGVSMDRVVRAMPNGTGYVLYDANSIQRCMQSKNCARPEIANFVPQENWQKTDTLQRVNRPIGRLLNATGIAERLPRSIARKVLGIETIVVFRVE